MSNETIKTTFVADTSQVSEQLDAMIARAGVLNRTLRSLPAVRLLSVATFLVGVVIGAVISLATILLLS